MLGDILLANGNQVNLNLPKFVHPLSFFSLWAFLALSFSTFSQYQFQLIKLMNSVVPSPFKTRPYNTIHSLFILMRGFQNKD